MIGTSASSDVELLVNLYKTKKEMSSKSMGLELVSEMVNQLNGNISTNSINGTENCINIPI